MNRQSTLPSLREQARHALLLLGVPSPARLVVAVHAAFFDGDLSVPGIAALLRDEERAYAPPGAVPPSAVSPSAAPPSAVSSAVSLASEPTAEPLPGGPVPGGPVPGVSPSAAMVAAVPDPSAPAHLVCPGLNPDLTAARGTVTLAEWPLDDRLGTPAVNRARQLVATIRVAEFAAVRSGAGPATHDLLRRLTAEVPGATESITRPTATGVAADLAAAARAALDDPALAAAAAAEEPLRASALVRAARLDERQRLFGVPPVPHQRGSA